MDTIKQFISQHNNIYFSISAVYEQLAKLHGLTTSSLFILEAIHSHPQECTQRLICDILFYPKQTVNTILSIFSKKGYISKKVSTEDKRTKIICLTALGRQFASPILQDMMFIEETAFRNMHPKERQFMLQGQRAFLSQLEMALDSVRSVHANQTPIHHPQGDFQK